MNRNIRGTVLVTFRSDLRTMLRVLALGVNIKGTKLIRTALRRRTGTVLLRKDLRDVEESQKK